MEYYAAIKKHVHQKLGKYSDIMSGKKIKQKIVQNFDSSYV